MKTLEKDRTRRYERAVELAADVERHLNNKPVLAAPPSMCYRLRKFVRRNRVAVVTVFLVASALIVGAVSTSLTSLTSDRLTVKVEQPTPNYRLILDEEIAGMPVGECDFSPSGDRIVFRTLDNLYVTDQTATIIRPLLDDLGPWEYVGGHPCWSPDGRLIAYSLMRKPTPGADAKFVSAIFVLNLDDGASRQIGAEVTTQIPIISMLWTPDSQHLTYCTPDGTHTLTLDGNEVRFIPREDSDYLFAGLGYSPDGDWLVFPREKEDESGSDLCILPVTGGQARRLTNLPGANSSPTWAPDGRTLYFVAGTQATELAPSIVEGSSNIWRLPMDQETGLAKGEPQQVTFFKDTIVQAPKVLGDGSRIGFRMYRLSTSIQVADSSAPQEARSLVPCGTYSPELSPDGQTVYYVNDTPGEEGIYAVSRQGGAPRRLTDSLPFDGVRYAPFRAFDLSDDGRTLAYSNKLGDRQVLYTVPATGGEPRLLVHLAKAKDWGTIPQWSPDGSQLAYTDGNDLKVVSAAGGRPHKLANIDPGYWEQNSIRWSPDGRFIAAFGVREPYSKAVFVVPACGGELRQLTSADEWKQGLQWHPDGRRLTYHVTRPDSVTHQAYLDGREPTLLVNAPDIWDYVGVWAPDGRRFFFFGAVPQKGFSMFVYDESSGKTTQVAEPGESGEPRFSRDGKTMAWWATRKTSTQTWIMENFLQESTAGK
jgi:Tol biopolymer transport system component